MSITSPSPERARHGTVLPPAIDDAHFRQYWKAQDRVEKLCLAGLITPRELRAANAFRIVFEHAFAGALRTQGWNFLRLDKHCLRPNDRPGISDRQVAALLRVRKVAQALGALFPLLTWAVVEDASWTEIGRRLGISCRTAQRWTAASLSALASI